MMMIEGGVAMCENIAEGHDQSAVRNSSEQVLAEPIARDLQLTICGRLKILPIR